MEFTKEENKVLKVLVEKELSHISEDSKKLLVANSPFFGKVANDDNDLEFIKSEKKYEQFLKKLIEKL